MSRDSPLSLLFYLPINDSIFLPVAISEPDGDTARALISISCPRSRCCWCGSEIDPVHGAITRRSRPWRWVGGPGSPVQRHFSMSTRNQIDVPRDKIAVGLAFIYTVYNFNKAFPTVVLDSLHEVPREKLKEELFPQPPAVERLSDRCRRKYALQEGPN